jgi:hypothetical protein
LADSFDLDELRAARLRLPRERERLKPVISEFASANIGYPIFKEHRELDPGSSLRDVRGG